MQDSDLWFGYLEAKDKSTPVLLDKRLDTANPQTIYLLNLARSAILEYRREIVEGKLRPLTAQESEAMEALKAAYDKLAQSFQPRARQAVPAAAPAPPAAKKRPRVEELPIDEDSDADADEELELEDDGDGWADEDE